MAYGDFKDLTRWIASDKIFPDKAFNIAKKIQSIMCIKGFLLQWFMKFLVKKLLLRVKINLMVVHAKNENITKPELAEELHKPIIRKI